MAKTCAAQSCVTCPVRPSTEWADLSDADLRLLDGSKVEQIYTPGETVYAQGDLNGGVHCIHSGLVGLRRLDPDGDSVLARLAYAGETVGYRSFLKKKPHGLSAEALSPTRVCRINSALLRKMLGTNPELGFRFLDHSLDDLDDIEERFVQNRSWPARVRLLHTLLIFMDRLGRITPSGVHHLDLPVSRREMAAIVGVSPEAMSRLVREVNDDGLARIKGRQVVIQNIEHIQDMLPVSD